MPVAQVTNVGLNLLRDVLAGIAPSGAITTVAIGTGGSTLTTGLTSGTAHTSLAVAALPHAYTNGAVLALLSGVNFQNVTLTAPAAIGATTLTVASFTANFSYPIGTHILAALQATDTALDTQAFSKAVTSGVRGALLGEGIVSLYLSPQDASNPPTAIAEVGWFAGTTLIARGLYDHLHTNAESVAIVFDFVI